ncbi:MAG: hypothetical protein MZV64_06210 [Ignavibacteriales bacterium]|nr:hypothetical protein [Ignavibacteriales bacterium]
MLIKKTSKNIFTLLQTVMDILLYKMKLSERGFDIETEYDDPELVIRGEKTEELETFHLFQTSIDISSDGQIAFVTKAGGTDVLHFFSINENEIVKTLNESLVNIVSPKYSQDGKKIVFHAVDQKGFSDLYVYDISQNVILCLD